jgi:type II secretory pathway pseudopilin PulG
MEKRFHNKSDQGYSMIEMLIVTSMIIILATMPIALLRRSREKVYEAQALRALNVVALGYENYWALNKQMYPNFRSDHLITRENQFTNAEAIWDSLLGQNLLPRQYSGYPHNQHDLLAHGYVFSIYPSDFGTITGYNVRNDYALAMIPYKGSMAKRGIAVIQGQRFFSTYPTTVPRKMKGMQIYSTMVYTLPD